MLVSLKKVWLSTTIEPVRLLHQSHHSAADPETSERGGARNVKYIPWRVVAIFFMTNFYRPGGSMAPLSPPPPLSATSPLNVQQVQQSNTLDSPTVLTQQSDSFEIPQKCSANQINDWADSWTSQQ